MPLIVTDQIGATAVYLSWPTTVFVLCYRPMQAAHLLIRVYMASQVNVLSAGKLVSSQMIYLTLCYLAILVTVHVHWMS